MQSILFLFFGGLVQIKILLFTLYNAIIASLSTWQIHTLIFFTMQNNKNTKPNVFNQAKDNKNQKEGSYSESKEQTSSALERERNSHYSRLADIVNGKNETSGTDEINKQLNELDLGMLKLTSITITIRKKDPPDTPKSSGGFPGEMGMVAIMPQNVCLEENEDGRDKISQKMYNKTQNAVCVKMKKTSSSTTSEKNSKGQFGQSDIASLSLQFNCSQKTLANEGYPSIIQKSSQNSSGYLYLTGYLLSGLIMYGTISLFAQNVGTFVINFFSQKEIKPKEVYLESQDSEIKITSILVE